MARVEVTEEALAEAERAATWYRENAGPEIALRLRGAIEAALQSIAAAPERAPKYAHGARRVILADFPYAVVYLMNREVAVVIAIAHAKRRPGYWRRRGRQPAPR